MAFDIPVFVSKKPSRLSGRSGHDQGTTTKGLQANTSSMAFSLVEEGRIEPQKAPINQTGPSLDTQKTQASIIFDQKGLQEIKTDFQIFFRSDAEYKKNPGKTSFQDLVKRWNIQNSKRKLIEYDLRVWKQIYGISEYSEIEKFFGIKLMKNSQNLSSPA